MFDDMHRVAQELNLTDDQKQAFEFYTLNLARQQYMAGNRAGLEHARREQLTALAEKYVKNGGLV